MDIDDIVAVDARPCPGRRRGPCRYHCGERYEQRQAQYGLNRYLHQVSAPSDNDGIQLVGSGYHPSR